MPSRDGAASLDVAGLCERLAAAATLDDMLRLLVTDLPKVLSVQRVVVTLDAPPITIDSQAETETPAAELAPVLPARAARRLWLLPRHPTSAPVMREMSIEVGGERLGMIHVWVGADDEYPRDLRLAGLRIVCAMLGQHIVLDRARAATSDQPARMTPAERRRWNEFLNYVAHEVKTPLTSIQGHAQLLSRYVRAARDATKTKQGVLARLLDDCERNLPPLEKQVARINQLIRDMLDLAQSDDGSLVLTPERANLASLVAQTAQSLSAELARGITVDAPEEGVWVACDITRMERVLCDVIQHVAHNGGLERDVAIRMVAADEAGTHYAQVRVGYQEGSAPDCALHPGTFAIPGTELAASPLDLRLALSAAIMRLHGGYLRYIPAAAGDTELLLALPMVGPSSASTLGEDFYGGSNRSRG